MRSLWRKIFERKTKEPEKRPSQPAAFTQEEIVERKWNSFFTSISPTPEAIKRITKALATSNPQGLGAKEIQVFTALAAQRSGRK